jgi:hypothetical protein
MLLKMKFDNKGQFLIFSGLFVFLLLIFIYSIETPNSYIVNSSKFNLIDNIIYETCQVGKISNGSYIDQRYSNFSIDVNNYCIGFGYNCSLSIINNTAIPPESNWSKLNYSHYNYALVYSAKGLNYTTDFDC